MNSMRNIRIEKLTLNIGSGKEQSKLEKGMKLIKHLTGTDPVKARSSDRLQADHKERPEDRPHQASPEIQEQQAVGK
jgi:ribosomal protein L5